MCAEKSSKLVLIISGGHPGTRGIETILLEDGYTVELRADGGEALEFVGAASPDAVIIDMDSAGQTGWGVLRGVREDRTTSDLPVMLLAESRGEEFAVLALESGADDFIGKPFRQGELLARVKRMIERREQMISTRGPGHPMEKVPVRTGAHVTFVPRGEIFLIEAAGKYCYVHHDGGRSFVDYSIKELEYALTPPYEFVRIHRSFMVNAGRISEVTRETPARYLVTMDDESRTSLVVSQRRLKRFKEILHLH